MPDNKSGSHRTGSSPSSRYNSGNSKRPGSYSERYNRPNPYTGYLPPGVAPAEQIYHPESVDPVRIKQLEREHEQARLHAYEDKANMPHSADTPNTQNNIQNNIQRQQRTQTTRASSGRSAQEAAKRGKQTRRAQVAQQHAARAASYRAPVTVGNDAHLNEIRQNAIDEAEKLRNQPAEEIVIPPVSVEEKPEEVHKESLTAGLPVAGAAQFAAMVNKKQGSDDKEASAVVAAPVIIDAENVEKEEEKSDSAAVIPVVIPASAVEVITPDAPSEQEEETPVEAVVDIPSEIPESDSEQETAAEKTEESEEAEDTAPIIIPADIPESVDSSEPEDLPEENEASEPESAKEPEEEPQDVPEEAEENAEENAEDTTTEEPIQEEAVQENIEQSEDNNDVPVIAPVEISESEEIEEESESTESIEEESVESVEESSEVVEEASEEDDTELPEEETDDHDEDDDDVKVYVSPEKNIEESEEDDDFDDEYYEYEDNDEYEEDVVTTPPAAESAPSTRRRNFETRISSELADPSAYSPGVAQDETLFIRKKRPEEATAVFAASTPGLAPEFDDDDFFEQWLEEGDDMIIKDKRQRRRVSAIIGGATMIFAIIGFIFVVIWFINGIPNGSKTSGSQTDYAKFILPVVNADPEPFETITSVDNNILVEAAINRLTYGEAAEDQTYTALEVENETRLLIPAADVDRSGKVLFGDTFTIDYTSMYAIEDEKIYYYSAADDCFHVITTGGDIEPEIIKISHIGSRTQVLLEVGYISASEETMEGSDYYKMMEYVLNAKEEGGYYVSAIRAIEEE